MKYMDPITYTLIERCEFLQRNDITSAYGTEFDEAWAKDMTAYFRAEKAAVSVDVPVVCHFDDYPDVMAVLTVYRDGSSRIRNGSSC